MKLISAISIAMMAISSLFATQGFRGLTQQTDTPAEETAKEEITDFEKAVRIIKKYETLHQPKHYPLIGYGHLVQPGEKYSRTKAMSESAADALLRQDLLKNCAVFRSYGADSLLLGVLAYNIGSGAALRSTVAKKLKNGDRDIYKNYIAHSRYRGKRHAQLLRRRIEEFETLFIKELPAPEPDQQEPGSSGEAVTLPSSVSFATGLRDYTSAAIKGIMFRIMRMAMADMAGTINEKLYTTNTLTACISR